MQEKTGTAKPVKCRKKKQGHPARTKSRQQLETALTGLLCGFYGVWYKCGIFSQQMPEATLCFKSAARRGKECLRRAHFLDDNQGFPQKPEFISPQKTHRSLTYA